MFTNSSAERQLIQALAWGTIHYERLSPANTQFAVTGRRIYVTGDIDGRFRPRSNPYDLYQFGKPQPGDPLGNRLQGVWAQPVKGITRYGYRIEGSGEPWILEDAVRFNQTYAAVQFDFERGPLQAVRYDYAALDLPLLFSSLTVRNTGMAAVDLRIAFQCEFDLQDAWFTHRGPERNTGQRVAVEAGRLVARSQVLPDEWAAAAGGVQAGELIHLLDDSTGEWVGRRQLAPGAETTLVFGMVVTGNGGAAQALAILDQGLAGPAASLNENQARFNQVFNHGPRLTAPDAGLCQAFQIAQANLYLLEAEQPELDRYFYAGLEMFPFWFSCDGAYSAAGLFAAGLRDTALNHIRLGYRHMQAQGRVPHQISPSGQVAFAGNAQETQQWVMSIWDAYRWTGDREFLAEMYPGRCAGCLIMFWERSTPTGMAIHLARGWLRLKGWAPKSWTAPPIPGPLYGP